MALPYHLITEIAPAGAHIRITISDGKVWNATYITTETVAKIETAIAAYTDPKKRITTFAITELVGTKFTGNVDIPENRILELKDLGNGGMELVVDDGTIYNKFYKTSTKKASVQTAVTPA